MFRRQVTMATVLAVGGVFSGLAASDRMGELFAQQPKTDSQSEGTPKVLPRPDFEYKGQVGKTYKDSDPPQFPQPVKAPKDAPNVVLILLDDSGFGQYSTFGGGVPSPTMDKLADLGQRYTRFHTTALCSPTRAALLTGRNHHVSSNGVITDAATGYEGYTGVIPRSCGTVGEVLRQNGYMTAWIGKNHNTPAWETSAAGPFDRWANGLGFDYFYGFNSGASNQWNPVLVENRNLVPKSTEPNYHLTEDLADKAIAWTRKVTSISPDAPFFMYVAPGANHAPHHAPQEWIDKFKGQYDGGWDKYREDTFARQKQLGVIPADAKLTERCEGLPAWETLNAEQKKIYARMMEVFAGFAAHVDHHMGRIVDSVRAMPGGDNTIFIYIAGDNGASAEGGLEGSLNENLYFNGYPERWEDALKHMDELGGPKWANHFPAQWAHAMNTPFQWTKQVASHFGGTRNPMVISWPAKMKDRGVVRNQFLHTIDLVPTLYDAIGITPPEMLNGAKQKPLDGISFLKSIIDKDTSEVRKTQYFELGANRAIYHEGWVAASRISAPWLPSSADATPLTAKWELYHIDQDFSQADNVAAKYPNKVMELDAMFWKEAEKHNVLPLDWRTIERLNAERQGRPSLAGKKNKHVYYTGQVGLPEGACPPVLNKSFTITAELEIPENGAEGIVITQGGLTGGYGLYMRDGKAHFVYNLLAMDLFTITSDPLPKGKVTLMVDFAYAGKPGEFGKGAFVTILVNGQKAGEGKLLRTIPNKFALGEGLDIGTDLGSAVDSSYKVPFTFTGKVEKVTFDLK
jgi:arylsulfatase A-like enzyme